MKIEQLWRYPVKSMGGESIDASDVLATGLDGDRRWGVVDLETGNVLTARREPRLLFATARLLSPEVVEITLPHGQRAHDSAALARWLGRPVALERAGATGGTYENPRDYESESDWVSWSGPSEAWHDMARARVSLLSTATIGEWDVRRFRPNVLISGQGEDQLVGRSVRVGSSVLDVVTPIGRCIIVTRPQPGIEADLDVLRTINKERATYLAVGAVVSEPGTISVGDVMIEQAPAEVAP